MLTAITNNDAFFLSSRWKTLKYFAKHFVHLQTIAESSKKLYMQIMGSFIFYFHNLLYYCIVYIVCILYQEKLYIYSIIIIIVIITYIYSQH